MVTALAAVLIGPRSPAAQLGATCIQAYHDCVAGCAPLDAGFLCRSDCWNDEQYCLGALGLNEHGGFAEIAYRNPTGVIFGLATNQTLHVGLYDHANVPIMSAADIVSVHVYAVDVVQFAGSSTYTNAPWQSLGTATMTLPGVWDLNVNTASMTNTMILRAALINTAGDAVDAIAVLQPALKYTISVPAGLSLIANQLDHGSNTADVVFPNPTGSLDGNSILKWNCSIFQQTLFDSSSPSGFSDVNAIPVAPPTVKPGEAFFFDNQSGAPLTLTFTGTPHIPVLPSFLPCGYGQTNFLGRQTNAVGTYANIVGLAPTQGAQERIWNGVGYTIYTYTNGIWAPTNPPTLGIGQGAVFVVPTGTTPPAITQYPQERSGEIGGTTVFAVDAVGTLPLHFQWFLTQSNQVYTLAGKHGRNLTIADIGFADAGIYFCVVTNAFGSVTSTPALLTVTGTSYTINIHAGYNLIANQLDHGSNTADVVLPSVPNGSVLYKYNNASSTWTAAAYNPANQRWTPPGLTLAPGEGAFLQSPTNFNLAFTGTPHIPVLPVSIPSGAVYLLSCQTNTIGNYTNITGIVPTGGEKLYRWNGTNFVGYLNDEFGSGWSPSDPQIPVGEAVWVAPANGTPPPSIAAPPVIVSWPRTQLVPVGSNVTLSVMTAGLSPMSLQWYRNNVPVASATGSVFNVSSAVLNDTAHYFLVASNAYGIATSPTILVRAYYVPDHGSGGNPSPTVWDFGDLPAPSWTCWQSSKFDDNCIVRTMQYTTKSEPPIVYPTTLELNGARQTWTGNTDLAWLGADVSATSDGIPDGDAKGDPGTATPNQGQGEGADFSRAGILREEDGIRMIPDPAVATDEKKAVDPRTTSKGVDGKNLFGSAAILFVPLTEGNGQPQAHQRFTPGQTVWFTVEAHNTYEPSAYQNGLSYLNVWIDYGDDTDHANYPSGNSNGNPDGKFQPAEYVIVDQPLWGASLLESFADGYSSYPYNTADATALANLESDLSNTYLQPTDPPFQIPTIGTQPYAHEGLQVVSFQIPPMNNLACGKQTYARFRITNKPLNLFRIYSAADNSVHVHDPCSWSSIATGTDANPYLLKNADGLPDPSLGETVGAGEVEDYPVYFTDGQSSWYLCMTVLNTLTTFTTTFTPSILPLWPLDAALAASASSGQSFITVADGSSWPVATPGDPGTWFFVEIADVNFPYETEIMQVKDTHAAAGTLNVNWDVNRGSQCPYPINECAVAVNLGMGSIVKLASRCQCQLDAGVVVPPVSLLKVSGTDPGGIPCDPGLYPYLYPGIVRAPGQYPFSVQVANSGITDMTGVTVSYAVPTNALFRSAAVSQGNWTNVGGTVSFNIGSLGAGETAQIGIDFQPAFSGMVNHQFNLSADHALSGSTNYQVLNYVTIKPFLSMDLGTGSNHMTTISWPTNDAWVLQQSGNASGGWSNAPVQTSPIVVPTDQPKQFFRLMQP